MKKKKILFVALAAVILMIMPFIVFKVCSGKSVEAFEISLNERDVAIEIGETLQLQVVPDEDVQEKSTPDISWTTKDSSVATVDEDGVVTGVAGGESRITAIVKYAGKEYTASCVVTVKGGDMEYSTYRLRYFTQKKDRNGYDITEEVYDRLVGSKVSITTKEASKLLPSNYTLNTEKSILAGTVKEHKGGCVLEIYYDVAQVTYSVESYYESASELGTYTEKETKKFKAYAFTTVELPEAKEGFKLNPDVKGSVLKKESVVAGNKLVAYYDRIESTVTVSYMSDKKDATYKAVYGVGLLEASFDDVLTDELEPYKVESYVNGKKTTLNEEFIKKLTGDIKVEFNVEKNGFTYVKEKDGGTLLNNCKTKDTDSYVYLDGASSSIYLEATYELTGSTSNQFGITIRSGKTSREIRFEKQGIKVTKDHSNEAGTLSGNASQYNEAVEHENVNIWAQNSLGKYGAQINSVVSNMLSQRKDSSHDVIWVIWEGTLYCSVDGQVAVRLPLNLLEKSWGKNSKYEIGFSACDTQAVGDELKIRDISVKYGKQAEKELITDGQVENVEMVRLNYQPFTGTYLPMNAGGAKGSAYVYREAMKGDSGIRADIRWENKDNSRASVGATVKLGDVSHQFVVEGMNVGMRHQMNYTYTDSVNTKASVQKYVATPFNADGSCEITAMVKDGQFYVLYNGIEAYCIKLQALFPEYNKNSKVAVGLTSYDSYSGLAHFENIEVMTKNDIADSSVNAWGFYSENLNVDGYDLKTGIMEKTGATGRTVELYGATNTWQVEGTMKRTYDQDVAEFPMGFTIKNEDGKIVRLIGNKQGFMKQIDNDAWSYAHTKGNDIYSFNDKSVGFFDNTKGKEELNFKAVIFKNVFYVWFDGELCWRVPLTEAKFGAFDEKSTYTFGVQFASAGGEQGSITVSEVKMGNEVTEQEEFESKLSKLDANVTRWDEFQNLHIAGEKADELKIHTTSTSAGYAYLAGKSKEIYLSAMYETLEKNTSGEVNYFGISIKRGDETREIEFCRSGIKISSNKTGTGTTGIPAITGDCFQYSYAGGNNAYIWAQHAATPAAGSTFKKSSVISDMIKGDSKGYEIEWAIIDQTLYGSIDDVEVLRIPLADLFEECKDEDVYQLGISKLNTEKQGKIKVSDIKVYYGDKAKNKLVTDRKLSSTDIEKFYYEAFTGSYMPQPTNGGTYIYNSATKKSQAITTTIHLLDKDNTASSNGITVKWDNQSLQIVTVGFNESVKLMFNHEQVAGNLKLPNNMKPYNEDGECMLTAVVKDEKLYILYNGETAGAIELNKIFKEYKSGDEIALGLYSWNADTGLARFMNTSFVEGEKADEIPTGTNNIWSFKFFTKQEINASVDYAAGTIANNGKQSTETRVDFMEESDRWEVTGTMYVDLSDTTTQMQPQFFVTNGATTFSPCIRSKGPRIYYGEWNYTSDNNSNPKNGELVFNKNKTQTQYFTHVSSGVSQRTKFEIDFKVVIANDVMYVWFESAEDPGTLVYAWMLPLTTPIYGTDGRTVLFNGFTSSGTPLKYSFGLGNTPECALGGYKNLTVKTGSDVKIACISEFLIKSGAENYDVTKIADGTVKYTATSGNKALELNAAVGANDDVYVETVLKKGEEFNVADYRLGFQFSDVILSVKGSNDNVLFSMYTPGWAQSASKNFTEEQKQAFEGNGLKIGVARRGGKFYMYVEKGGEMEQVLVMEAATYAQKAFNIKLITWEGAKGAVYRDLHWEITRKQ